MSDILVLIVEDDLVTSELIENTLNSAGYITFKVQTGRKALEYLERQTPSLIILDIVLPDINGHRLLEIIRDMHHTHDIPIIISSAKRHMEEYYKMEDQKFRPDAFLSKPYKLEDLVETVREVLIK